MQKDIKSKKNTVSKKGLAPSLDFLDSLDKFFSTKKNLFFYISLFLTLLFSLLLFDVKVSTGGDDSNYIYTAYTFVKKLVFPAFQGPLYPLFLSPFILIFGVKVVFLKVLSLLFIMISMFFFYKTFEDKIPPFILVVSLVFLSINSFLLYYSSQTYTEAFFIMLQSMVIWGIGKCIEPNQIINKSVKYFLLMGICLFVLSLARNVAIASIIAIAGFFILEREWKKTLFVSVGFIGTFVLIEVLKKIIWGGSGVQVSNQASGIMYKDYFNPSKGNEDFIGFINRFIDNSNLFFSKHLFHFLGLRSELNTISPFLTVVIWSILIVTWFLVYKKNKILTLITTYTIVMCSVTFIALQKEWDQLRMIVVYLPYFIIILLSFIYNISKRPGFKFAQVLVPIISIVFIIATFSQTSEKVKQNKEILANNMKGNLYYGFTPDWIHFFQISKWAADNLPKDAVIASRKASMSFIYSGGRDFYPIFKIPTLSKDTAIGALIKRKANVIVLDNFELENKKFPPAIFDSMRLYNRTMLLGENRFYTIYEFLPEMNSGILQLLSKTNISARTDLPAFNKELDDSGLKYFAEDADNLVKTLKSNNIKYLILANIRANPNIKDGNIINTLQRYVLYIQLKYPKMFRIIYQIGNEDDEPAQVVEVVY